MAIAPQNQDAFLREVDEEVRRDRLSDFGRRWGRQLAVAVAVAMIAFAAWLYWQHRRDERAAAQGVTLSQLLGQIDAGHDAGASAQLGQMAASNAAGYADAARVTQAGLLAAKGDAKVAAVAFANIAADGNVPQTVRDLAIVRQTALEYDTLPPATVVARLAPYAVAGNAWFGSAGEMVGLAYLKQNKPADAGRLFAALAKDRQVPETIRARAVRVAGMLGVDVVAERGGATAQ